MTHATMTWKELSKEAVSIQISKVYLNTKICIAYSFRKTCIRRISLYYSKSKGFSISSEM